MNRRWFGFANIASIALAGQIVQAPMSLRVVDTQGATIVITKPRIDYGGLLLADVETDGVRVRWGDGAVAVKWSAVDSIRAIGVDSTTRPPTIHLEVLLRSGVRRPATLLEKGRMQLTGQTDLGEYSVDLHKVRLIAPVR